MEASSENPDAVVVSEQQKPEALRTPEFLRSWLWRPYLIAFVSSACVMVLELVAGRIIAPYVGVSLYTWTSVIGIVLAGISLGNYTGGLLADRWASLRLLGVIFLIGGLASVIILSVDLVDEAIPGRWHIITQILVLTSALFFLPSAILGCISPVVAKLAVRDLTRTGSTVGRIYASGSIGSIVGTFLTGFVLISWFGTYAIVVGVAAILTILGLLFLLAGRRRLASVAAIVLVLAGSALVWKQTIPLMPCTRETNYFCIKIREEEKENETVRLLILDRLVHSYTSLQDPTKLVYDYEKLYSEATEYKALENDHLRALFIGGGGYTFPKYMESIYPESTLEVIEIDPGVTQVAYEYLGLSPDTRIVTYNEDARMFLAREPENRYDLILGDAFNDYSVPYHLTTKEFNERVKAWLEEDGFYLVNIIDSAGGQFLRSYTNTLSQVFPYVYVVPSTSMWRTAPRTTFVLLATSVPVDLPAFATITGSDDSPLLAHRVLSPEELDEVMSAGKFALLTDQYAPVDQMLAAVFRDEAPKLGPDPTPTSENWDAVP